MAFGTTAAVIFRVQQLEQKDDFCPSCQSLSTTVFLRNTLTWTIKFHQRRQIFCNFFFKVFLLQGNNGAKLPSMLQAQFQKLQLLSSHAFLIQSTYLPRNDQPTKNYKSEKKIKIKQQLQILNLAHLQLLLQKFPYKNVSKRLK